jgi:MerR family mercuric resistance operon transcriptional regulator
MRTTGGYRMFEVSASRRLRFARSAVAAGSGLDIIPRLCKASDAADGNDAVDLMVQLRRLVARRRLAHDDLEAQLAAQAMDPRRSTELSP